MNLSETIIKEMKNIIPMHITIENKETAKNSEVSEKNTINTTDEYKEYTQKQINKQDLIIKIKRESEKGKSNRAIAKEYGLSRTTIAKYIKAVDIKEASIYDSGNKRYSYLDPYKDEIEKLYKQEKSILKVYEKLKNKGIQLTYSTLRHYISQIKNNNDLKCTNEKSKYKKISRNQIIKYIFNWKYKEELLSYLKDIMKLYPILKTYKDFYHRFREYLVNLNTLCFVSLLSCTYKDNCINKFIKSLKQDWEAVLNAASLPISNGVAEGNVNKIKQIKRDMYGRASYELLRKKVIYQSSFN